MKIKILLRKKKPEIIQKWFESVIASYPVNTSNFKGQKNSFVNNIVGHTIADSLDGTFNKLLGEEEFDKSDKCLDDLIRVRAIQEFTPSEAVDFIFSLKKIIREELKNEIDTNGIFEELMEIESRIDKVVNISFDIYMQCREKIFELKANEMKNWTYRAIKRTNMYREEKAGK